MKLLILATIAVISTAQHSDDKITATLTTSPHLAWFRETTPLGYYSRVLSTILHFQLVQTPQLKLQISPVTARGVVGLPSLPNCHCLTRSAARICYAAKGGGRGGAGPAYILPATNGLWLIYKAERKTRGACSRSACKMVTD